MIKCSGKCNVREKKFILPHSSGMLQSLAGKLEFERVSLCNWFFFGGGHQPAPKLWQILILVINAQPYTCPCSSYNITCFSVSTFFLGAFYLSFCISYSVWPPGDRLLGISLSFSFILSFLSSLYSSSYLLSLPASLIYPSCAELLTTQSPFY